MEFAIGLINLILIFIIVRSLLTLFYQSRVVSNKANNALSEEEKPVVKEVIKEMVKDEVCNRSIPKKEAHILVQGEDKHYFCSWECREKFLNSY